MKQQLAVEEAEELVEKLDRLIGEKTTPQEIAQETRTHRGGIRRSKNDRNIVDSRNHGEGETLNRSIALSDAEMVRVD